MAMDALKNLVNNIPVWQTKLDELSSQIAQRQTELAAVAAAEGKTAEVRSIRNQGSTESLKPKDDGPMHGHGSDPIDNENEMVSNGTPGTNGVNGVNGTNGKHEPRPAAANGGTSPPRTAAHSRAAAQLKKKRRSASLMSGEGVIPLYRTRTMIEVYYDSFVQGFFDDLVRFVSTSRNMMRKAKMAAKVAQIKRMAEMEPEDGSGEEGALPSLRYMSTRQLGGLRGIGGNDQPPDVYDNLDKALDAVQMTCEHGAHQFLRDADCNDELKKIQLRMSEAFEMAEKEIDRVQREEPELAKENGDAGKARTRRHISMRREFSATQKEDAASKLEVQKPELEKLESRTGPIVASPTIIEPDGVLEADEGIDLEQAMPVLKYRSTRGMRARGPALS
jgi:hypothetical protein